MKHMEAAQLSGYRKRLRSLSYVSTGVSPPTRSWTSLTVQLDVQLLDSIARAWFLCFQHSSNGLVVFSFRNTLRYP